MTGPHLALAAITAAYFALLLHFAPPRALFGRVPVLGGEHAVEVYRTARAHLAWTTRHRLWVYDPQVLAGGPVGLTERFGTRIFVYGVGFLSGFGADPVFAFGAILFALHALVPLVGFGAARAFALSARATALAVALWSSLWFFDALVHSAWFSGRIAWNAASGLSVLALGLCFRVCAGESLAWTFGVAGAGVAAMAIHPIAGLFGIAVAAAVALRERSLLPARRTALLGAVLLPLAALSMFGGRAVAASSEPVQRTFDVGPGQILWDFVEVLGPGYHAPGAARTLVRVFCLAGAFAGISAFRASGDRRYFPFAAFVGGALALAYFGSLVPVAWPMDPYYFAIPATLAASLAASDRLAQIPWSSLARSSGRARIAFALAVLVVVPRIYRTVATYVPSLLPDRVFRSPPDVRVSALVGLKEPGPDALALEPPPPEFGNIAEFLTANAGDGSRVVVDDPALAGFLAIMSPVGVLGPIGERGAPSASADPSPLLDSNATDADVHAYVDRYAVGWVVLRGPPTAFDRERTRFDPAFPLFEFRVRHVRDRTSLFEEGSGVIVGITGGVIRVADAGGKAVTLRYHYDPALGCRPGCVLERATVPGDAQGFLRIPNPPSAFEIY